MLLLLQDFPTGKAGQNGQMYSKAKVAERARTREVGRLLIDQFCPPEWRFRTEEPLAVTVLCCRPSAWAKKNPTMDLANLPGMLKGYLDGFTLGGLWPDDRVICDLRVRWLSLEGARRWCDSSEEAFQDRGVLLFHIRVVEEKFTDGDDVGDE